MAELSLDIDASEVLVAIAELHALVHAGVLPGHLRERLERLQAAGDVMVELPNEVGGAPFRLGPSPELLCILATLRALKGAG